MSGPPGHREHLSTRDGTDTPPGSRRERHLGWALVVVGAAGAVAAALADPVGAGDAAVQDWSPFVLVAGLILIGLVADDDGLFAAAGHLLARLGRSSGRLFLGAAATVGVVTALLNLDTSVAFLTPVLVYGAVSRGGDDAPLLYGCLLLSNAGSMLLPGSNLTNLIVLGHLHLTGGQYLARSWLPSLCALAATAGVVAVAERRALRRGVAAEASPRDRPVLGLGLAAVVGATVLVVALRTPALPVAAVGVAASGARVAAGRDQLGRVVQVLGLPVLAGLFGIAVALGTLGRAWAGPTHLLAHAGAWVTAAIGAGTSVLVNNLPAASLLAARTPRHPFALLAGLDIGPNLFVTGSLAWFLWLRAARGAGARPSLARAARLGLLSVPVAMAAALGALALTGR